MEERKLDSYARRAYADLLKNYWTGDEHTGCIIPTWTGIPVAEVPGGDPRGGLWERGMMLIAMDNYYQATHSPDIPSRMRLEAERMKKLFSVDELADAGGFLHHACDDCGWHARLYLLLYRYEKDPWLLGCAKRMVDTAAARWMDNGLGGGMWYEDTRTWKSLYQVAIVLACLDIYEITKEDKYLLIALECYNWMEAMLKWKNGLYWTDLHISGTPGQHYSPELNEQTAVIGEAGSPSFLGGNMAMMAIHAILYKKVGLDVYRERAEHTGCGLLERYIIDGCFINDRDAWTDTTFLGEWVREYASLPGYNEELCKALIRTAFSVAENARTSDGHYSAAWRGPTDDSKHRWGQIGSVSRQITTSATSANWLMCALQLSKTEVEK